ncbi:MAG: homocysteine biosynthesis protein [Prochlorococcaceae cyanobacterium]
MPPSPLPRRSEAELVQRQASGSLRVRSAAAYRAMVQQEGLAAAYGATDVVVAADAQFSDQASLVLALGPSDPPIRIRRFRLGGVEGLGGSGSTDLVLPIGGGLGDPARQGGAQVLAQLLAGESLPFSASGEATALQPRRDLDTRITLAQIGSGRLLLHRAIVENGIVALNSAEGLVRSACGPLLGPWGNALYTCGGAGSIGLTMPKLALLGPGSAVLVAGAIGWVVGAGSGHQPQPRRQPSGHARSPGAAAAVSVDLHQLDSRWIRPCFFEGQGSALLVAIAAPVPLLNGSLARQAAADHDALEAPLLDLSIPRRVKPGFGGVSYGALRSGVISVGGRRLRCAPAHSPQLAASLAEELCERLRQGSFPLRLPLQPLSERAALIPLEG